VVGITLVAHYIHPRYTGIVYAIPIVLVTAVIFLYLHEGADMAKATVRSTLVYESTLIYFIFTFYFLLGRIPFWYALTASLLSWILLAFLVQLVFKGWLN